MSSSQAEVSKSLLEAVRKGESEEVTKIIDQYGLSYFPEFSEGYVLLCDAIRSRFVDVADILLEKGANVNGESESSPLHLAVEEDILELAESLLKYGAKIECLRLRDNYTPLHIACSNYCNEIVGLLLKNRADPNAKADDSTTPLYLAAEEGNFEILELLLEHGAEVIYSRLPAEYTPLHIACEKGWVEIVNRLLKSDADPNAKTTNHTTPLHLAVGQEHEEIIKSLLEHGADINYSRLSDNFTPLHVACEDSCYPHIIEYLLNKGASPNIKANDNINPLHLAAKYLSSVTIVESLLNHGAEIDCLILSNNYTPLLVACAVTHPNHPNRRNETVNVLLNHDANPNARANDNTSPLHLAAKNCSKELIESLLNHGAKVNCSRYEDLYTPLHIACSEDVWDINIVEMLLNRGADQNIKSNFGMTPLHVAVRGGDLRKVEFLLKHNPYVDSQTGWIPEGWRFPSYSTPLHIACFSIHNYSLKMVDILLNSGANPDMEADDNITPLHVAINKRSCYDTGPQEKIIESLLKHEAFIDCARSSDGYTPLHIACAKGDVSGFVDVLLRNEANPNVRAKNNVTPLHVACGEFEVSIAPTVESLLRHGAEVNCSRLPDNYTPLHLACDQDIHSNDVDNIVHTLLSNGADPNVRTSENMTPLYLAVKRMHVVAVKQLLHNSADINMETHDGLSPLDLALKKLLVMDEDRWNATILRQIVKILKMHVIKLKVAGLHVSERNLDLLHHDDADLHRFQVECEKELAKIKTFKFSSPVTLYCLLKGQWKPADAWDESVMQTLRSFNLNEFPIYFNYFQESKQRVELLISGANWFEVLARTSNVLNVHSNVKYPYCPELVLNIVSYLSNEDLKRLSTCGENLKHQFCK